MYDAPPMQYDESDKFTARLAYISEVYKSWWQSWYDQVLPTLIPFKKWKKQCRNLEKNDIVFVHYPSSIQDEYRLARVIQVYPDVKGNVRTVRIAYRKRDVRDKSLTYKSKPLVEELVSVQRLSVQRLSVLLPASEQTSLSPVS